jgi:hypothetical protein
MPFSLRLDPETEARIRRLVSRTGWSKALVVREAVAQYRVDADPPDGPARESPPSAFDRLRPYMAAADTGGAQLSRDTHRRYRALLRRKHRARRSR